MADCTSQHCSQISDSVNATCKKNGWTVCHAVLVCDRDGNCCDCHCSCMQWGTLVAAPAGNRPVQDFKVGDEVLAAGTNLNFQPLPVEFSNGTGRIIDQLNAVYINYGAPKELVVTPDHVFYLYDGKIKRADTLTTADQLVNAGTKGPVAINSVKIAPVQNGFHHISTTTSMPTSLDGHLINVEGIVSADYAVQLYFDELKLLLDNEPAVAPIIGSDEYRKRNPGVLAALPAKTVSQVVADGPEHAAWPHTMFNNSIEIPANASSFVTKQQAKQIRDFVPKRRYDHTDSLSYTEYLMSIYEVFYPEVTFRVDWPEEKANAFSWEENGQYFVVVQGGLIRALPLNMAGISLAIAHELGHLFGDPPKGIDGYACEGSADYYATWIAMRRTWYGSLYQSLVFPAMDEVKNLFSYLSDRSSTAVDGCVQPTLDCRLTTFMAGVTLADLPACAGGLKVAYLELLSAEVTGPDAVVVGFNEALNQQTAEEITNYIITPPTAVQRATLDPNDPSKVTLTAAIERDTEYRLYVQNLLSADAENLDPDKSAIDFSG